jgi:excinuclease ABC subunit A
MNPMTATDIVDKILTYPAGTKAILLAPIIKNEKGEFRDVIERLAREGFVRIRIDGNIYELTTNARIKLDPEQKHTIEIIVDRLVINRTNSLSSCRLRRNSAINGARNFDSLETV